MFFPSYHCTQSKFNLSRSYRRVLGSHALSQPLTSPTNQLWTWWCLEPKSHSQGVELLDFATNTILTLRSRSIHWYGTLVQMITLVSAATRMCGSNTLSLKDVCSNASCPGKLAGWIQRSFLEGGVTKPLWIDLRGGERTCPWDECWIASSMEITNDMVN